jgi:hypothetical protein
MTPNFWCALAPGWPWPSRYVSERNCLVCVPEAEQPVDLTAHVTGPYCRPRSELQLDIEEVLQRVGSAAVVRIDVGVWWRYLSHCATAARDVCGEVHNSYAGSGNRPPEGSVIRPVSWPKVWLKAARLLNAKIAEVRKKREAKPRTRRQRMVIPSKTPNISNSRLDYILGIQ